MPSIATWNINSVRTRLPLLLDYLRAYTPDVLLLQELKAENAAFPYMEIETLGYNCAIHGQKTYNGVAVLSKFPIDEIVTRSLPGDDSDEQARYIEVLLSLPGEAWRVASVYVPNGMEAGSDKFLYKLRFLDRLHAHLSSLLAHEETCIIGGDYNVAPFPEDVYAPKTMEGSICFNHEERIRLRAILNAGYTDAFRLLTPAADHFSWWDYRGDSWSRNKGMRIDHLLLSPYATDRLNKCEILKDERAKEKPSDHVPVVAHLN